MDIISWIKNQGIEVKGPHYYYIYAFSIQNIGYAIYSSSGNYTLTVNNITYENDEIKEYISSIIQGP